MRFLELQETKKADSKGNNSASASALRNTLKVSFLNILKYYSSSSDGFSEPFAVPKSVMPLLTNRLYH